MRGAWFMGNAVFEKIKWAIIFWLARRLPDCKTMTPLLGETLDRKPTLREKLVMRLHLFTCEACERYLGQIKFLKEAMHIHGEKSLEANEFSAASLSSEAKSRIKDLLRAKAGLTS